MKIDNIEEFNNKYTNKYLKVTTKKMVHYGKYLDVYFDDEYQELVLWLEDVKDRDFIDEMSVDNIISIEETDKKTCLKNFSL